MVGTGAFHFCPRSQFCRRQGFLLAHVAGFSLRLLAVSLCCSVGVRFLLFLLRTYRAWTAGSMLEALARLECGMEERLRQFLHKEVLRLTSAAEDPSSAESWLKSLKLDPGLWQGPPLVVLSLFDGIGGVWAALSHLGIPYKGYSAEINHYALQLLKARYPNVQHIGDVTEITKDAITEKVDLVVGGFPCQDLSAMGKKIGLHGSRSRLFFEMLRIIELFSPRWFLVENVASMFWVDRDEISNCLSCLPIEIDSQELTPNKRRRLYWTNFGHPYRMPNLRNHYSTSLQSILEKATALELKAGCILAANYTAGTKAQLRAVIDNETKTLRYITTTELEKLMGYPAGYTNIKYKSSLGGGRGRKGATIKESHRIRWSLLGNSFSVPVIAYLLHSLVDEALVPQSSSASLPKAISEEESSVMNEGELWALYNSRKRPNWYAEIVSRTGGRFSQGEDTKLEIVVRFLELAPAYMRGEADQWSPNRGTGLYDCHTEVERQDCWVAFSHRVNSCYKVGEGYFIYPGKDEIWAIHCPAARNHYFVYILESEFTKARPDAAAKPDKEGYRCFCRVLQETDCLNTFRFTDMSFECTNMSIFAFQTPYLFKNSRGFVKLETNGIRGSSQNSWDERRGRKKRKKNGDDTSDDDEEEEEEEEELEVEVCGQMDMDETPPEVEEPELVDEVVTA